MPRLVRVLIRSLPLVLLLVSRPAWALEARAELGLAGQVAGDWTSLVVRCSLDDDEPPLRGRVTVDLPGHALGSASARIDLAPGGTAVARLTVPVLAGAPYAVRVEDERGRTRLETAPERWELVDSTRERLLVHLAPSGLGALTAPGQADAPRIARVAPADLPPDLRALESVVAVVLPLASGDPELLELLRDPAKTVLLERYVAGGGTLLLMADPSLAWTGAPIERLSPLAAPELVALGPAELEPLLGELPQADATIPVVTGELRPGAHWRFTAGEVGLVAEQPRGLGRVLFAGLDPDGRGVRGAEHMGTFLTALTSSSRSGGGSPVRGLEPEPVAELARQAFAARAVLGPLGFALLAAVLLAHIAVVGPLATGLTRKRGPWAGLLLPPAVSAAFATAVVVAGALTREAPRARALQVVTQGANDERPGRGQLELALFADEEARFVVNLDPHWAPAQQARGALAALQPREGPPTVEFVGGLPRTIGPVNVPAHGLAQLRLAGSTPRLALEVVERGGEVEVRAAGGVEPTPDEGAALVGLVIRAGGEVLLQDLELPQAGRVVRWRPAEGGARLPPALEDDELPGDPFAPGADAARAALVTRVAAALAAGPVRARATAERRWLLHVALSAGPVEVKRVDSDGRSPGPAPECLRITVIPVGDS